jgi:hypothetical protein
VRKDLNGVRLGKPTNWHFHLDSLEGTIQLMEMSIGRWVEGSGQNISAWKPVIYFVTCGICASKRMKVLA